MRGSWIKSEQAHSPSSCVPEPLVLRSPCTATALLTRLSEAISPLALGQKYFNRIDAKSAGRPDAFQTYFGASASRLREIKHAYDPDGLIQGLPGL